MSLARLSKHTCEYFIHSYCGTAHYKDIITESKKGQNYTLQYSEKDQGDLGFKKKDTCTFILYVKILACELDIKTIQG